MNNKVYVNQKDIWFILKNNIVDVPGEVLEEIVPSGIPFTVSEEKYNEFFIFKSDIAKNFFRKQKYIINYSTYIKMDIRELYDIMGNNANERFDLSDYYASLPLEAKKYHKDKFRKILILNHINASLNDIVRLKENNIRMILPEKEKRDRDKKYKLFLESMLKPVKY